MRLLLERPDIAARPCAECQKWLYDDKGDIEHRGGQPQRRPPGVPTPCWSCPKKSPAEAPRYELSRDNWKTVRIYVTHRATGFRFLRADRLLAHNLGLVDRIWTAHERALETRAVVDGISATISTMLAARLGR